MASIYPNRKDGKIVSFKFRWYGGRDENGRQIVRCTTWTPDKPMSERKLLLQAEKEATIWERQLETETHIEVGEMTFARFVDERWLPHQKAEKENRETTLTFYEQILKVMRPHFDPLRMQDITDRHVTEYLSFLKNTYRTAQGKMLSPKWL